MTFTLEDYIRSLKEKRVAVIGVGVSNAPLIRLLLMAGISVTACDKKEDLGVIGEQLKQLGVQFCLGEHYLDQLNHDVIFRSPGIRPDIPAFLKAKENGSIITSEMEVFFDVCPCKMIAVTGSDGKTTTTTLISEMLKNAGYTVHVGGNIGKPLLSEVWEMAAEDIVVLELSSFQLMTLRKSPNIAIVTNLSPNHLDIHTSMAEYCDAKENIFSHQTKDDICIFNHDNEWTRNAVSRAKGKRISFSRQEPLQQGVFVENAVIYVADENGRRRLFPTSAILIPGEHNVENYLAAIAAVNGLVPDAVIKTTAETFAGVEHRIELVRTLDGVRYYNDSIASSPTRTIAGLRSFAEKVILIAGGYDKKIPFDGLGPEIVAHVKTLILTGHTAEKIKTSVLSAPGGETVTIHMAQDMAEAVSMAHKSANQGDIVILSPACASFDAFPNFAVRGTTFKKLVSEL
ncbi:MAG: UDP-N-acetylmuramoyl-L-alanine--D-glutamate ligase [Evtepia sp.]